MSAKWRPSCSGLYVLNAAHLSDRLEVNGAKHCYTKVNRADHKDGHHYVYAADVSCFRHDIPIQSLNQASGGWVNVFLDLPFDCNGVVTGWQFYATRTGTFFAGIWRLEGQNIRLIDKNRIVANATGTAVCI